MTNEQWLVYLYGIYPDGGWSVLWTVLLIVSLGFLGLIGCIHYSDYNSEYEDSSWYFTNSFYYKLGKLKWVIPSVLALLLLLSNLIPNKQTFMYLVATPYIVDGGKNLMQQLDDETSKVYKLNKLMDLGLDKAIKELEQNKKENK